MGARDCESARRRLHQAERGKGDASGTLHRAGRGGCSPRKAALRPKTAPRTSKSCSRRCTNISWAISTRRKAFFTQARDRPTRAHCAGSVIRAAQLLLGLIRGESSGAADVGDRHRSLERRSRGDGARRDLERERRRKRGDAGRGPSPAPSLLGPIHDAFDGSRARLQLLEQRELRAGAIEVVIRVMDLEVNITRDVIGQKAHAQLQHDP
jgi:hypothetical protein